MKVRLLQKLLNTTRSVTNQTSYIAVGSAMVHNLFSVDVETLNVKYALDSFRSGRACLMNRDDTELLDIYDKLCELVENGQMKDILEGNDEFENPITIYYCDKGLLKETTTDSYTFPNVTAEGYQMYDTEHFLTKKPAIIEGLKSLRYWNKSLKEQVAEKQKELNEREGRLAEVERGIVNLTELLKEHQYDF